MHAATLSAVMKAASLDDHEEILQTVATALKSSPTDSRLLHTKVVALLKLDRYADALRVIEGGSAELQSICRLERSYALYKSGRLAEATDYLSADGSSSSREALHLKAQLAYRDERFLEAYAIYNDLLSQSAEHPENHDLQINKSAAAAQMAWQPPTAGSPAPDDAPATEAFEVAFNTACASLGRGELSRALQLLTVSSRLCDALEDLPDEEKQAEMLPILLQQAYTYFRMGDPKHASSLYGSADSSLDLDAEAASLQKINEAVAAASSQTNPFLSKRIFQNLLGHGDRAKLFSHQRSLLDQLDYVSSLHCQKFKGVENSTSDTILKTRSKKATPYLHLSVINAAAKAQGAQGPSGVAACQQLLSRRPLDLGLVLTLVQLCVQQKNTHLASCIVSSLLAGLEASEEPELQALRYSPGLIALAVTLYRSQGTDKFVLKELAKVAARCEQDRDAISASFLREVGLQLVMSHQADEVQLASATFDRVLKELLDDDLAIAGAVASRSDVSELASRLPSVESLVAGIDAESMLQSGISLPSSSIQVKRKSADQPDNASKRKRRRRVPKNAEPGKAPDPERWLPLRDRSSYRPKGKKGRKKVNESTQGGVVNEEVLELVGGVGAVKVEKTAPAVSKKKKKGRK